MSGRALPILLLACLALPLAGCRASGPLPAWARHAGADPAEPLAVAERGDIRWEVAPVDEQALAAAATPPVRGYVHATAREVQCRAAERAWLAELLAAESGTLRHGLPRHPARAEAQAAVAEVLQLQALHQRNEAAAEALEAYYRLVEAEHGLEMLDQSLTVLEAMLDAAVQLRDRGLPAPADVVELDDRRQELESRRLELLRTIGELNGYLSQALQWPLDGARLWPSEVLVVEGLPPSPEAAVAAALQSRADLRALWFVSGIVDPAPELMRPLLNQVHPLLGLSFRPALAAHLLDDAAGDRIRSLQLARLADAHEETIAAETTAAVATLAVRHRQVFLAAERHARREEHVGELQRQRAAGRATAADVDRARLAELEARQQLLAAIVQWQLASVELRRVQGLLAAECSDAAGRLDAGGWEPAADCLVPCLTAGPRSRAVGPATANSL